MRAVKGKHALWTWATGQRWTTGSGNV